MSSKLNILIAHMIFCKLQFYPNKYINNKPHILKSVSLQDNEKKTLKSIKSFIFGETRKSNKLLSKNGTFNKCSRKKNRLNGQ